MRLWTLCCNCIFYKFYWKYYNCLSYCFIFSSTDFMIKFGDKLGFWKMIFKRGTFPKSETYGFERTFYKLKQYFLYYYTTHWDILISHFIVLIRSPRFRQLAAIYLRQFPSASFRDLCSIHLFSCLISLSCWTPFIFYLCS